jgi:hypothetical protein
VQAPSTAAVSQGGGDEYQRWVRTGGDNDQGARVYCIGFIFMKTSFISSSGSERTRGAHFSAVKIRAWRFC